MSCIFRKIASLPVNHLVAISKKQYFKVFLREGTSQAVCKRKEIKKKKMEMILDRHCFASKRAKRKGY